MSAPNPIPQDYQQPELSLIPRHGGQRWPIQSIDQQILTKIDSWNQDATKRSNEFEEIKKHNANYVGLAMPYDNGAKWKNYVPEARAKGFAINFRPQWNSWEGQNSAGARVTAQRYLDETYDFILNNRTLFAPGDLFTMCPESNNADNNTNYTFRTPANAGGSFTMSKWTQFLKDMVSVSNAAFRAIGLDRQVHTWCNSISLSLCNLHGQTLTGGDGGNASGVDSKFIKDYFNGILTIDHYLSGTIRDGTTYARNLDQDLEIIHKAFSDCLIFIGEWGYHTDTVVTDAEQKEVYEKVIEVFKSKSYILGINFWVQMGSTTASLWSDTGGTITKGGRSAVQAVHNAFVT